MPEEKKCKYCAMWIPKEAKICPHCRKKQPSTTSGLIILLSIIIGVIWYMSSGTSQKTVTEPSIRTISPKEKAIAITKLDFKWGTDGLVMIADFIIQNQSEYDIKDITIECSHSAKSGTPIDSNTRTIYDIVKAGQKKRFPNFNMGFIHSQAVRSNCKIINLEIAK